MIRLHFTAEGQTEEKFVKEVLSPHLANFQVFCDVRCVLTSENKKQRIEYRGGFRQHKAYETVRKDIVSWMQEDKDSACRFTTMFDFYALPQDFPGQDKIKSITDKYEKVTVLEQEFASNIIDNRFVPYIQLHEFEALIFANPAYLELEYLDYASEIRKLINISEQYDSPEMINDGAETAPSKRIIAEIPEYENNKTNGAIVAKEIGLSTLRLKCKHFDAWLTTLEKLDN